MTKDFKKFTIHVGDWESSNLTKGIGYAKQENALEVSITWEEDLRTPDPVMESRAVYVFAKLMGIEHSSLKITQQHKGIIISRCDGRGFDDELAVTDEVSAEPDIADASPAVEEEPVAAPASDFDEDDEDEFPSEEIIPVLKTIPAVNPLCKTGVLISDTSGSMSDALAHSQI